MEMCRRDCFTCPFTDCTYNGPPRRGELLEAQRQVDTLLMITSPAPKPKGRKRAATTSTAVHGPKPLYSSIIHNRAILHKS